MTRQAAGRYAASWIGVDRVTKEVWPVVICPGCRVQMGVKKVSVDEPGKASGKIIYACEICKTETRRLYKGPKIEEMAPHSHP